LIGGDGLWGSAYTTAPDALRRTWETEFSHPTEEVPANERKNEHEPDTEQGKDRALSESITCEEASAYTGTFIHSNHI